jgi:hypothetical protein
MIKMFMEKVFLVLGLVVLAGCRTDDSAPSREWQTEDFQTETHLADGSLKVSATVRDGLLHVVDKGTESGDMVRKERHWNASPEVGASAEARVRVVSCEGLAGVMLEFCDGVHEDILTLYTNRIELDHAKLSHAMDTTDDFHVYRVEIRGTNVSVLADGKMVINGIGRFTKPAHEGRNWIGFGAGSSSATGEAFWDWVRWTAAPVRRKPEERDVPGAAHHVVYKQADRYACFPSLAIDPATGHLYTRFQSKKTATHYETAGALTVTKKSLDGGATWNDISAIPSTACDDMPGPAFTASDGARVRINQNWRRWFPLSRLAEFKGKYAITDSSSERGKEQGTFAIWSGGFLERSEDGGHTWRRMEIPGLDTYASCSSPWSNAQLPDGTILRAFWVRPDEASKGKVVVVRTRDGRTCEVVPVMDDPDNRLTFTEETLVHTTLEGAVWMLTRVHGDGDFMWQAVSRDGGRTWISKKTGIDAGQSPPSGLVKLDDGRLVMVYGCRRAPFGIRALVSEDEGLTWRMDHVLVLREDGEGFDLGYPRAVKLPGGDVLAVYYYATADGVRHIACTRFTVPRF